MNQAATSEDEAYAQALALLKDLEGAIHRLRDDQRVWEKLQRIIGANPALHRPSSFYRWMQDMYVSGMAMSIRRLIDPDENTISFMNFWGLVKQYPGVVSRERYWQLFKADSSGQFDTLKEIGEYERYVDSGYDGLVGPGKNAPDPKDIQGEIGRLRKVTKRIGVFATKVIAHTDREKPTNLPKFGEIGKAIDEFASLVKRYVALTRAASLSVGTTAQYDDDAIFRIPWIMPK